MPARLVIAVGCLFPYFLYLYFFGRINGFFSDLLGLTTGLDVSSSVALLRALDVLRMMLFNEGLIALAVWGIYGIKNATLYAKFSVVFILSTLVFKGLTYFTQYDLIQKIAFSMGLLGSNFEWLLLVLASFYFIKKASN